MRIKGRWFYLYRAIDSAGATIDFFLSAFRSAAAAKALFAKALADFSHPQPGVINTDKAKCYAPAILESKAEGILRRRCRHPSGSISEQHPGARPPCDQETDPWETALSSVRVRAENDLRLRDDAQDPERTGSVGEEV